MLNDDNILLSALASMRDGVVIADVSTQKNEIVYANPAFSKMIGYDADELLGQGTRFLLGVRTRPTAVQAFRKAITDKLACQVIVSASRKNGAQIWLEITGAPLRQNGKGTDYYVGTCRDVSARVEAIENLLATEIAIEETKTDHHEGTIDKLTSLYNRHYFEEYAEREWLMMMRQRLPVTLMMLAIRNLDSLERNDEGGVSASTVIEAVANGLHGVLRRGTDLLARYDDHHFVAISAGMGWDEAETIARKMTAHLDKILLNLTGEEHLRCRLGVSTSIPDETRNLDGLIESAFDALRRAMEDESNNLVVAEPAAQ